MNRWEYLAPPWIGCWCYLITNQNWLTFIALNSKAPEDHCIALEFQKPPANITSAQLFRALTLGRCPIGIRFVRLSVRLSVRLYVCLSVRQYFGSDTITWLVFKAELSYIIHRLRMIRVRHYTFWSNEVKGQGRKWTLSTPWFWHNNLISLVFNIELSYFIHRCRISIHLRVKMSKVKVTTELC